MSQNPFSSQAPPGTPPGSFPLPGAPIPPPVGPGGLPVPPFVRPPGPPGSFGFPPVPPMMVPGGLVPPVMPVAFPPVPKSTDVYIGKIPNSIDDETIRKMLDQCGEVRSWKRTKDPDTQQSKAFGFCEFIDAEGVMRAIRLLNGLKVENYELIVRSSSATTKYVEAYRRDKALKAPEDKEEGEHVETEEQKDRKVLDQILEIIKEKQQFEQKIDNGTRDAESEINSVKDSEGMQSKRHRRDSPISRSGRSLSKDRRELESIIRDEESAYRKRLYEWESYERKIEKELLRESDIQRELHRERARLRRIDMEENSDDEKEPWARRPYKNTRRADARRRRRKEEEKWDAEDRANEAKEQEEAQRKAEEAEDMEIDEPPPPKESVKDPTPEPKPEPEKPSPPQIVPGTTGSLSLQIQKKKPFQSTPSASKSSEALKDIFGDEEEEKPKRELKGLSFSEIDTKLPPNPEDVAKNLVASLPKTKDEVYNYPIKWEAYKADVVGTKIRSWLNKKVQEILGFEEDSLTIFIMNQLDEHQAPSSLEKDLAEVLDDEQQTETFIIKLYRNVIYETEKAATSEES